MALFTTTNFPVNALIEDIGLGKIGLPELQRPFVWPNVNVRNLFDSLYRGYPAGFLLFWETGAESVLKGIGAKNDKAVPKLAIVDGQQRLTALYSVIKGVEVLRANFKKERIQIAFSPLSGRFAVADAAIRKDKAYIPDISVIWQPGTKLLPFARKFINDLAASRELTADELDQIEDSLSRLYNLPQYQFVALELISTVEAETIADVFVRINGEGKKLNQADFIMTLMSVFWDDGRADLEAFALRATRPSGADPSPFNYFIKPAPHQILRVTIGLSLKRARLESVYGILRGRDANTGLDNPERRDQQFALMREGQNIALNLANWHHFLSSLTLAGYRSEKMISSQTAIIYSYVLYLIGIRDYGISREVMRQVIAEFFFMTALTGRYTNSPETRFESDLAMFSDLPNGPAFVQKLRDLCSMTLTGDYWAIALPNQLATSAARSPSRFAYQAALILLDALALYSPAKISAMLDPAIKGTKAALEQHHLFPRGFLESAGFTDLKLINQIANFAPVEWPSNIKIGKSPPAEYVPVLDAALSAAQREQLYFWHALPPLWWQLSYEKFLVARRTRMAQVIHTAWKQLTGDLPDVEPDATSIVELIAAGESDAVEFKSTLRFNLHIGQPDDKIQMASLKSIAGFLNAKGGTLIIGVADNGDVLGLSADGFQNKDKMALHVNNLIRDRIGDIFLPYIHADFEQYNSEDGKETQEVMAIRCEKGPKAAFVKDGAAQRFFVRGPSATAELHGTSITDYAKQRFG
jgi:hypothetical protein